MFTTRQRRVWLVGALLVPGLLSVMGVLWHGGRIEQDLGAAVATAVGTSPDRVTVDGRDVTVHGAVPRDAARVRDVAAVVPGVAEVTLREAAPGQLLFFVRANEIVLAGTTAGAAQTRELVDAVRSRAGSYRVTPALTEGASSRLPIPVPAAIALIGAVVDNGVHDFSGVVRDGALTAVATVVDPPRVPVLRDALDAAAGDLRIDSEITAGPSASGGDLDVRALADSITRLVSGNGSIRFLPSSTAWQGHGPVLIERVGRMLLVAPRASVTVLGHASVEQPPGVDPRGLAETRARLVRDVLVGQGVSPALVEIAVSVDNAPESIDSIRQVDVLVR